MPHVMCMSTVPKCQNLQTNWKMFSNIFLSLLSICQMLKKTQINMLIDMLKYKPMLSCFPYRENIKTIIWSFFCWTISSLNHVFLFSSHVTLSCLWIYDPKKNGFFRWTISSLDILVKSCFSFFRPSDPMMFVDLWSIKWQGLKKKKILYQWAS